jgi:molybdopterin converting factor small subunit
VRLRVRFSGVLPSLLHVPASELAVEAAPGSTLGDLMRQLEVPEGAAMAYAVNGRVRPAEFKPADGDEIVAIPSIAGG